MPVHFMMLPAALHAFLPSFALVALGEIGDKTQLLSLALVCRFRKPWIILLAILLATLANHSLSVWLGEWLAGLAPLPILRWVIGISFVLLGLWMLIPDQPTEFSAQTSQRIFLTSFALFFVAEIGDKTQLATVALAANYQSFIAVLLGTTLGMLAANAPVLWLGQRLAHTRYETLAHRIAATLFVIMGLAVLIWP